jgi:O-methyltransferase involved in polyketide biosynthesis
MARRSGDDSAHDVAVMATASDASLCKLSASSLGYFEDPFVQYFVKTPSRRMPIINRGYYARVAAIESVVTRFVDAHKGDGDGRKAQIVILGAGLDSMYFRLKQRGALPALCEYFEMDFPDVTLQKVMTIRRRKQLMAVLGLESSAALQAAASAGT